MPTCRCLTPCHCGTFGAIPRVSGRVVPEIRDPTVREVIWRSFRLVYELPAGRQEARVLTVFRAERLFPTLR